MRAIIAFLLVITAVSNAERDWSNIFPGHVKNTPFAKIPHGIPDPRITGGVESRPNSHPYQAALFIPVDGGTAFCGGTLISRQTVLTAAHCVESVTGPVEIVLGAHRIREEEVSQVRILSSGILIHPQWSSLLLRNDIALLRLPNPVVYGEFIQPITLATDTSNTFEGHQATAVGWGRDSDESQVISDVLREVTVPVISNSVCNVAFLGVIQETHICASGSGGKSTCNGDSGGPLIVGGIQVGLVSFGIALGCEVGFPHVYTRVADYNSWIIANLI